MRRLPILLIALCAGLPAARAQDGVRPVTVAKGLQNPWGLAFLPDGAMLVTERPGRMRVVARDGSLGPPLSGLPAVDVGGQGGLLDVALDPKFGENRLVYWSYSEAGDGGNGTAVARGRLDGNALADVHVVFRQQPKVSSRLHFGSRLVFARDGRLFVTLGDRGSRRDDAQRLDNHIGKVVRIEPDGRAPADNPYAGQSRARPELWSHGHRNVQGAALHPQTGALWTNEHGPQGGDELNVTEPGRNHGWPDITYGVNYGSGTEIGKGTERADVVPPVTWWVPTSIAPSGMAFLTSERYPGWQGSLFVGALRARALVRLQLDGRRVANQERLLSGVRVRDVRQGPDGWLYVLADDDSDGRILRLER
jgi:glucose/arabinose dehydrogenase